MLIVWAGYATFWVICYNKTLLAGCGLSCSKNRLWEASFLYCDSVLQSTHPYPRMAGAWDLEKQRVVQRWSL